MSNQDKQKFAAKGELLDYGHAPYQDNSQNSSSYFVQLRDDNGLVSKKWGVDLERAIGDSGVQKGDVIALNNLGKQAVSIPDPNDNSKSITVNKTLWQVDKYEPALDLPNAIEHDSEHEQRKAMTDKTKEDEHGEPTTSKPKLSDFENELPDNIKNNYVGIVKNRFLIDQKTNYYDKNDKEQVNIAFEERKDSLHTSRQDEKTINAMLDLAESKGWSAIKLKGTEEFKQKAWLEASLRGIETKGYTPSEKDKAELITKQKERTTNEVDVLVKKEPSQEPEQQTTQETASEIPSDNQEQQRDKELSLGNHKEFIAVMPTPLQTVVAGASLAKNIADVKEYAEHKLTPKEVKQQIAQTYQDGYRNGTIKSRDDLVIALKQQGYQIRENEKSISVLEPNASKWINLTNDSFTRTIDNIKELKARLEPDILKRTYPNLKDSDIVHITAYKNKIIDDYKDTGNTKVLQASLTQLESGVKELASGKDVSLPSLPINEIKPDIQVRTTENHDKTQNR